MKELMNPNPDSGDDLNNLQAFKAEFTQRFAIPLNVVSYALLILSIILNLNMIELKIYLIHLRYSLQ